jgi:prepilin-type N-terminal cleavage/methylation domain-containing protein
MNYFDSQRGFTLIEIMVVIFVGLVLGTVVITSLSSARQKSRDSVRISDISKIQLALEQFYDSCGQYPNSLTTNEGQQAGEVYCPVGVQLGTFLSQIPVDPSTKSGYYYYATGSGTKCYSYHIGASLETTSHTELKKDSDITSSPAAACTGGGSFVSGADPVYDGTPSI